ncbi:hypothetical protein [Oceanobacillus halotolerans]|uniref:hypothetical protein n=1 Tax=Oceanobacillus halotolerans TaxID=2663380 RepID=UPI0013DA7A7E|nr:hypothetical protein [Oceanobacillus halotolerans]
MSNEQHKTEDTEALLLEAVKIQAAILRLLDNTLHDTYRYEKSLPKDEQNEEIIHLTERARNVIAKKPKLKAIYEKLEMEYGINLMN